jgi:hypothetical protein
MVYNQCLNCGKETKNKEFCCGKCRANFNMTYKENNSHFGKRSYRGLRA